MANKLYNFYKNNTLLCWVIISAGTLATIAIIQRKRLMAALNEYTNKMYFDKLNPYAKPYFSQLLEQAKSKGQSVLITSSTRSYADEVKNVAGHPEYGKPENSPHLFGFALDLNIVDDKTGKRVMMADNKDLWEKTEVPALARAIGLRWGGDFNSQDRVHFDVLTLLEKAGKIKVQTDLYPMALKQFGTKENINGTNFKI